MISQDETIEGTKKVSNDLTSPLSKTPLSQLKFDKGVLAKLCNLKVDSNALTTKVEYQIPPSLSVQQILEWLGRDNPNIGALAQKLNVEDLSKVDYREYSNHYFEINWKTNNLNRIQQIKLFDSYIMIDSLVVGAGLFRDLNGFPSEEQYIGTEKDNGDLLRGMYVRVANGSTIKTGKDGLYLVEHNGLTAHSKIFAAGIKYPPVPSRSL